MLLYFVSLGIDVTLFFLMVRFVLSFRPFRLLIPFDKTGEILVNATTEMVTRFSVKLFNKDLPEKGRIVASMMALTLIDLMLVWISKSVF